MSILTYVYNPTDLETVTTNNCNPLYNNYNFTSCNLRSAWGYCEEQNTISNTLPCIIELAHKLNISINAQYGSLELNDNSNIQINGNNASITSYSEDSSNDDTGGNSNSGGEQQLSPMFPYYTGELSNTNYASIPSRSPQICVNACYGELLRFTACEYSYTGDTYIYLMNKNTSAYLISSDDSCGLASSLSYLINDIPTDTCNTYCIVLGCYSNARCSYTINGYKTHATASSVPAGTAITTNGWPFYYYGYYTYSATMYYSANSYNANQGDVLTFTAVGYPNNPYQDTYFRLMFNGVQVAENNDYGDTFNSKITYTALQSGMYTLYMGCNYYYYCYATVNLYVLDAASAAILNQYDPRLITYQRIQNNTNYVTKFSMSAVTISYFGSNAMTSTGTYFNGGALYFNGSSIIALNNIKFSYNTANYGGHIAVSNNYIGTINIQNCYFTDGSANAGGSLYIDYNITGFKMSNSIVTRSGALSGGAIYINKNNNNILITNSIITDSGVLVVSGETSAGGCIYIGINNINMKIINSDINYCTCTSGNGGGIYLDTGNAGFLLNNTNISLATANQGGGIYINTGNDHIHFYKATISNCKALTTNDGSYGGGIYINTNNFAFDIVLSTITGNKAYYGGGIASQSNNAAIILAGTIVSNNTAIVDGGGLYLITNHTEFVIMDYVGYSKSVTVGKLDYVSCPPTNVTNGVGTVCNIYNTTIVVPGCSEFMIIMNPIKQVNSFDLIIVTTLNRLFYQSNSNNFPGITVPSMKVTNARNGTISVYLNGPTRSTTFKNTGRQYGFTMKIYPLVHTISNNNIPSQITLNSALTGNGGGLMFWSQNLFPIIMNSIFSYNTAKGGGGGVMLKNSNTGAGKQKLLYII